MKVNLTKLLLTTFIISNSMSISDLSAMHEEGEVPSSTAHRQATTAAPQKELDDRLENLKQAKEALSIIRESQNSLNASALHKTEQYSLFLENMRHTVYVEKLHDTMRFFKKVKSYLQHPTTSGYSDVKMLRMFENIDNYLFIVADASLSDHYKKELDSYGDTREELRKIGDRVQNSAVELQKIDTFITQAEQNLARIRIGRAIQPDLLDRLWRDAQPMQEGTAESTPPEA